MIKIFTQKNLVVALLVTTTRLLNAQCPTPTVSVSQTQLCSPGGTVNFVGSATNSNSIVWYTVPVAGTSIGISNNLANFNLNISTTTTLYAESSIIANSVQNFTFTGSSQTLVIPPGVTSATLEVWGAEGGGFSLSGNSDSGDGGKGGYASGTLAVTPGNTLNVYVGGFGQSSTTGTALGGFNGGGQGHASSSTEPGNGGGGASDIRLNGNLLTDRIIVAGGGGGGGEDSGDDYGHGGGLTGIGYVAEDATQTTAGSGAGLGFGGGTGNGDGGGGGGGYYGGGTYSSTSIGDDTQGGGGGSGYVGTLSNTVLISGDLAMPSPVSSTMTGNSGNGYVRITLQGSGCVSPARGSVVVNVVNIPTITIPNGTVCSGSNYTLNPTGASIYAYEGGNSIVSPTITSTYTVIGINGSCVSSAVTATISVNASPTVALNTATTIVCTGGSTILLTGSPSGGVYSGSNVTGAVFTPNSTSGLFTPVYSYTNAQGCSKSASVAISVINCTGMEDLTNSNQDLIIYPNPSNGLFVIKTNNTEPKAISVSDITGRSVYHTSSNELNHKIDISHLNSGIYFVKVMCGEKSTTVKIVKE